MKKKIPLIVHESLERFVKLKGENFIVIEPDNFLVRIIDADNDSDFYFNIEEYKVQNGLQLHVDFKPANKLTVSNSKSWVDIRSLDGVFGNWVKFLDRYETVNTFFDDPILKSFVDDYYAEFEIVDENAESKPLKPNQILLLDKHLEYIENNIDQFKTENNKTHINDIKKEVIELRENLTSKPKEWVVRKLSIIWGKLTKQGTKLLKKFVSISEKQIIIEGVKYLIEEGPDLINKIL